MQFCVGTALSSPVTSSEPSLSFSQLYYDYYLQQAQLTDHLSDISAVADIVWLASPS